MGKPCAYPGCRTGRRAVRAERTRARSRQLSVFQVPGNMLQRWSEAIQHQLAPSDLVCELHFSDSDVVNKDRTQMPDGEIVIIPRRNYSLVADALPIAVNNGTLTQCQASISGSRRPTIFGQVTPILSGLQTARFQDIHQARRCRNNINAQCNNHYTTGIATGTPSTAVKKDAMDPIQSPEKLRAVEAQYRTTVSNKLRREREKVRVHCYTAEILNV